YTGRRVAEGFPVRDAGSGPIALCPNPPESLVVPVYPGFILIELRREGGMVFMILAAHDSMLLFRISAMCFTVTGLFCRRRMPSRCIRQLISEPVMTSAPCFT